MATDTYTYRIELRNEVKVYAEKYNPDGTRRNENPEGTLRYDVVSTPRLQELCQHAFADSLTAAEVVELGTTLFNILFQGGLQNNFLEFYEEVIHRNQQLLRLELDIDTAVLPTMAHLPWEFMRVPANQITGELVLAATPNIVFSRYNRRWTSPKPLQLQPKEKLRVAVMVARPSEEELQNVLYKKLFDELEAMAAELIEDIELHLFSPEEKPATDDNIDNVLETVKPHIFHFIGHGRALDENGNMVNQIGIVKDSGGVRWVSGEQFGGFLDRFRPSIVILQACEGAMTHGYNSVADHIVQHSIAVVVAMQYKISNAVARRFAREFYHRLAQEHPDPVDKAIQEGRYKIANGHTNRNFATPVLYMRVQDGRLFQRNLNKTVPPPPTEKIRRALLRLNYDNQERDFNQFLIEKQQVHSGAFLISGPEESGQRWILKRLLEDKLQPKAKFVEVIIGDDIFDQDVALLWQELATQFNQDSATSRADIINTIREERQNQHILIVIDDVTSLDSTYPKDVVEEFWQPLSRAAVNESGDNFWLLLFMIDNDGNLKESGLQLVAYDTPQWKPQLPIQLEELYERFPRGELLTWLGDRDTLALDPIQTRYNQNANELIDEIMEQSRNGKPMRVIKKVCNLCGESWKKHEKGWLKL